MIIISVRNAVCGMITPQFAVWSASSHYVDMRSSFTLDNFEYVDFHFFFIIIFL